jgi:hypothetical protein
MESFGDFLTRASHWDKAAHARQAYVKSKGDPTALARLNESLMLQPRAPAQVITGENKKRLNVNRKEKFYEPAENHFRQFVVRRLAWLVRGLAAPAGANAPAQRRDYSGG